MTLPAPPDARCRRVAAEVLELGETLFDAVLDAAAARPLSEEGETLPEAQLRRAAEEFFQAVRALLGLECGQGSSGE